MMKDSGEFLTVQEVAVRLRVNEATVRRWIKAGVVEAITLPHSGTREVYRIRQATLHALLNHKNASKR